MGAQKIKTLPPNPHSFETLFSSIHSPQDFTKSIYFLFFNSSLNARLHRSDFEALYGLSQTFLFEDLNRRFKQLFVFDRNQGIYKEPKTATISTFIPGSEIMQWFSHQSMGNIVKAQVTPWKQNVIIQMPNHSCNKWMGMAACAIFSPLDLYPKNYSFFENSHIICYIEDGVGELAKFSINCVQISLHHLWLLYLRPEFFDENARAVLSQIDENESIQLEVRFQFSRDSNLEFEKCGFQMAYKQDMEDIRGLAQSSNSSCIISYEVVDAQHDLDNSMLVTEGTKIMRSHDECDEAGPSGESGSNDVPHLKRNQTYIKDELVIVTLIAWLILLKVVQDWIEDTDDPETNLLVNRIHFGKMFAPCRKLTKQSILILSFSTHFNLLHQ